MSNDNPAVVLYDALGRPLAVQEDAAIPANTPRLLVAGKDNSGNARTLSVDSGGKVTAKQSTSATGTLSSVAASTSTATLLVANSARVGFSLYNDSTTATLYLALGSGASLSAFTLKMAPGGYYESPVGFSYTGIVTGVWSAASGNARLTECT